MAEHGGNLSEAMQAREAAILREQGVTQPWEGDGHMHTGTLADGVGGMQDRELRILMERGADTSSCSAPRSIRMRSSRSCIPPTPSASVPVCMWPVSYTHLTLPTTPYV